jgi:hypothetical protein
MSDDRYNRWQGLAIAQLSVAIALLSSLSVAGLGVGLVLVRDKEFMQGLQLKCAFAGSMALLFLAAFCSCSSVITRTLDFRLTARKVRKARKPAYSRSLTICGLGPEAFGRLSWGLFWLSCLSFTIGSVLLIIAVSTRYASLL